MIIKDALSFIVPLLISAGLAAVLGLYVAAVLLLLLSGFVGFFFRNPAREIPSDSSDLASEKEVTGTLRFRSPRAASLVRQALAYRRPPSCLSVFSRAGRRVAGRLR